MYVLKGIVHPKMKISPRFTLPQVILEDMTFCFQSNKIRVILKNGLALPNFIMAVNDRRQFEAQKSASIHDKSAPHINY